MTPAISLHQPWASLLFSDPETKVHETRHWHAPARLIGRRVLVHAAKKPPALDLDDELAGLCAELWGSSWRRDLPRGFFVGSAILASSLPMRESLEWCGADSALDYLCGGWCEGRVAWRMADRQPFAAPIPAKGQQGWWAVALSATGEQP